MKVVETSESQADFHFLGATSADTNLPAAGTYKIEFLAQPRVTPPKLGRLTNIVRIETATGQVIFASAAVTVYSDQSNINKVYSDHLEGLARSYSSAFPKPPAPPPGDAIEKVDLAVLNPSGDVDPMAKPKCEWLTLKGRFKSVKPNEDGACDKPIWLRAKLGKAKNGKTQFSYEFKRELPPGKYIAYSRATNEAGVAEPEFTKKIGNEQPFKVKR